MKGFIPQVWIMFCLKVDLEGSMYPLNLKEQESMDVDLL